MFCEKCGAEMLDGVCPNCKDEGVEAQPVLDADEAYRVASKANWYCYLLPIFFFVPILKEKKNIPGNIDVANNALWLLILAAIAPILANFISILSILSAVVSIFSIVMAVKAYKGEAMEIPYLSDIKIIK